MSDKWSAIVLVGSVAGVVVAAGRGIPVLRGCVDCLVALIAGGAVVWYYAQDQPAGVEGGTGAGLGAGTAVVTAVVTGLLEGIFSLLGLRPGWDETRQQALQRMREVGSPEPQIEMMRQLFESFWFPVSIMACGLLLYVILGAVGGLIGASIFGQEEQ